MVTSVEERIPLPQSEIWRWHRFANPIVCEFFKGMCTGCHLPTPLGHGTAHHCGYERAYPFTLAGVIFLCMQGELKWKCYYCHDKIHGRRLSL